MAVSLGEDFKPLLLPSLYKIIERAGSANAFLSKIGMCFIRFFGFCAVKISRILEIIENFEEISAKLKIKFGLNFCIVGKNFKFSYQNYRIHFRNY